MRKISKKRLLASITTICMIFNLFIFASQVNAEDDENNGNAVYAEEFDLSRDNASINGNGLYRVYGKSNGANRIEVKENLNNVQIVMDGASIESGGNLAPLTVGRNSIVTVDLAGNNYLTAVGKAPAVEVNKNEYECGNLIITGDGSLTVTGGKNCPAIGGNSDNDAGNIEIRGGTVNATGGEKAAAIGSSYKHDAVLIKISGGTVNALASGGGAGIGGGFEGNVKELTISGGRVTASASESGAGIGGGYRGYAEKLQISGGDITASTDEYAFAIGSGRYSAGSDITISNSPRILAFTSKNTDAIEYNEITSNSMAAFVTGTFSTDYFESEQKIEINGNSFSKSGTMAKDAGVMSFLVPSLGEYSISANGINLYCSATSSVTSSNQKDVLNVNKEYMTFTLRPSCACEQNDIIFNISDIRLTTSRSTLNKTNNNTSTVQLSASGGTIKRWSGCPKHKGSTSATYEYYIVSDPSKIAEINGRKLKVTVPVDGVYNVVVGVKATAQDFVKTAETTFSVVKTAQADTVSIADSSINITKNGAYTISGTTTRNSIKVDPGLEDVTIILNSVTINLSDYEGTTASPIEIGEGSNVTIDISRGTSRITSNDKGTPICVKNGTASTPTVLTITGSGKLYARTKNSGACIGSSNSGGGTNTKIYILDGDINAITEDGYCIGGKESEVFIAEGVKLEASNQTKSTAPILGTIISEKYKTYEPAVIFQGLLEKPLDKSGDIIFKEKEFYNDKNDDKKLATVKVENIPEKTSGFVAILKDVGSYTASLDTGASSDRVLYEGTSSKGGEDYYVVDNTGKVFDMYYDECKCSISAPKLSAPKITIPYDSRSKSVKLDASGGIVKSSEGCSIHSDGAEGRYSYSIVEDEDHVFSASGSTLTASASEGGKYTGKLRVRVSYGGLSAEKTISISAEKVSKEDMEKKMGKEHTVYLQGDESGNFRPDDFITRAEVTAMLSKVDEGYATAKISLADFSDVGKSEWYSKFISYMAMQNIVTGYEDGSFKPNEYMTRAEFAAIACRQSSLEPKAAKTSFSDIDGHWATDYICSMSKKKYITGYEDKSFRPDNLITRAEATVIINRLLGRQPKSEKISVSDDIKSPFPDVDSKHWAYYDIIEATTEHFAKEFH